MWSIAELEALMTSQRLNGSQQSLSYPSRSPPFTKQAAASPTHCFESMHQTSSTGTKSGILSPLC